MGHVDESIIEWSAVVRPRPGEAESGDACLVRFKPHSVLIAVVDGLGHGAAAADAARAALAAVEDNLQHPLTVIADRCHSALRGSRGAVMSLACIDGRDGSLDWLGIGNVAGFIRRAHPGTATASPLLLRSGVLGHQTTVLRPTTVRLEPGDILFMVTDGIRWNPAETVIPIATAQTMAHRLLRETATDVDDALAMVVRYRGVARQAEQAQDGGVRPR